MVTKNKTGLLGAINLTLFLYLLLHVYVCVVEIAVWESRYLWRPEERVLLPGAAGELPDEGLFTCSACS